MRGSRMGRISALGGGLYGALLLASGPAGATPPQDPTGIWTFQVENDAVSTLQGTSDQYYTSGLRLGWTSGTNQVPDFLSDMAHAVYGEGGVQRVSLNLEQSIFTPRGTQLDPPDPHDRPYVGYLNVDGALINDTDNQRTLLGVTLGLVGPDAGGRQVQNGFHNIIGDTPNRGWHYQLRDEFTFEVRTEGTWRVPITRAYGVETDALPTVQVGIGNVRDYALAGINFRIGQGLGSDYGVPRIEPGMTGADAYTPTRPLVWYFFAGVDGQGVLHDITLDGNTWRSLGPHVSKKWYVGEIEGGAAVIWHGVRITYAQTWQTEEFHGQKGGLFNFGSLSLSARF